MDGATIRKRIAALGPRKRGGRLPEDVQREVVAYARQRRADGGTVKEIAREMGVSGESVRRWAATPPAQRPAVVPVRVRAEGAGLVLHTAAGHRLTGLDVAGAVQVLRLLG